MNKNGGDFVYSRLDCLNIMDNKELLELYKGKVVDSGINSELATYLSALLAQSLTAIDTLNSFTCVHINLTIE